MNFDEEQEHQWRNKDVLEELYCNQGLTMKEVGNELGCSKNCVHNWMQRHNIERKTTKEQLTSKNAYRQRSDTGYEVLFSCQDEMVHHRLIMVAEHGIDSVIGMHIHHKNEIPWDNRVENLEAMTPERHSEYHTNKRWKARKNNNELGRIGK